MGGFALKRMGSKRCGGYEVLLKSLFPVPFLRRSFERRIATEHPVRRPYSSLHIAIVDAQDSEHTYIF